MTRRFKRLKNFDVSLEIKNEEFIRPPRDAQRNWLLNRALAEFADELNALHASAARFVAGAGGNRTTGMLVELTGNVVLDQRSPFDLAAER